ncbi:MAG: autotransporter-associated beta strand repeat-containing protein [Verrucomicrobiota bacterium]
MKTRSDLLAPRLALMLLTFAVASLVVPAHAADKLFGGTTSWVNGPWNLTGIPGSADNGQFGTLPSSATAGVAINMGTIPYPGNYTNGSIEITAARSSLNLIIGNSSTTYDGTWTLNGSTLNSVDNTVIRNNGAGTTTLTIQNLWPGAGSRTMPLVFNTPASAVIDATKGVVISSIITKADYGITKLGAGTLTLNGDNTYAGPTTISAGKLSVGHNNALGTAGAVTIGPGSGGVLYLGASGLDVGRPLTMNGGGATGVGALHYNVASGSATYSGNITINALPDGGGHFGSAGGELNVTGPITSTREVRVRIGKVRFSSAGSSYSALAISGTATLQLGATDAIPVGAAVDMATTTVAANSVLDLNGCNQELAGLTRNANAATYGSTATVDNTAPATAPVLTLNIAGTNEFSGDIRNTAGTLALAKAGSGVLTLTGVNSYSGSTTVSNGTLLVNGHNGASAVAVESGATLGGNGIMDGAVTVNDGGTLSPGTSIGTLTINNDLALRGNTLVEVNRDAGTNDFVGGIGILSAGGTLTVTNSGSSLQSGDSFHLFGAANYSGSFTIVPDKPGDGLSWVLTNGVLSVISTAQPTLQSYFSPNDGTLQLSWTGSCVLQAQTNATGIGTNWHDYSPGGSTSPVSIAINPAERGVFYRLRSP